MLVTNARIVTYDELREMAAAIEPGTIKRLILHWTAGRYDQIFDDYHLCIDNAGLLYMPTNLTDFKSHTYKRNTGSLGIALCCGIGASALMKLGAVNFGPMPPTVMQIECMAHVVAILTQQLSIELNEKNVFTHCEAAMEDGYGPGSEDPDIRWDLWYLPDFPSRDGLFLGGEVLRRKAKWYQAYENNRGKEVSLVWQ
jgi:hypothetical protein